MPHRGAATSGLGAALLPVLACAVCPACLGLYAKIASAAGLGFALGEHVHLAVLALAIGLSLLVSAWRSVRHRRVWPILIALVGCTLVLAGHLGDEAHALEWTGVAVLVAGGLAEHVWFARRRRAQPPLPLAGGQP